MSYKLLIEVLKFEENKHHYTPKERDKLTVAFKKKVKKAVKNAGGNIINIINCINDY